MLELPEGGYRGKTCDKCTDRMTPSMTDNDGLSVIYCNSYSSRSNRQERGRYADTGVRILTRSVIFRPALIVDIFMQRKRVSLGHDFPKVR